MFVEVIQDPEEAAEVKVDHQMDLLQLQPTEAWVLASPAEQEAMHTLTDADGMQCATSGFLAEALIFDSSL